MSALAPRITVYLTVQQLIQANIKKNPRSTLLALCEGNPLRIVRFPSQRASNEEGISMSWPFFISIWNKRITEAYHPGGHCWDYINDTLTSYLCQYDKLQVICNRVIKRYLYDSFSNDHRGDPYHPHCWPCNKFRALVVPNTRSWKCWKWRCSWSSADRRWCSNYIWVNNYRISY